MIVYYQQLTHRHFHIISLNKFAIGIECDPKSECWHSWLENHFWPNKKGEMAIQQSFCVFFFYYDSACVWAHHALQSFLLKRSYSYIIREYQSSRAAKISSSREYRFLLTVSSFLSILTGNSSKQEIRFGQHLDFKH